MIKCSYIITHETVQFQIKTNTSAKGRQKTISITFEWGFHFYLIFNPFPFLCRLTLYLP